MEDKQVYIAVYNSLNKLVNNYNINDSTKEFIESLQNHNGWHYDIGDDPSFYSSKESKLLTWGICRPDIRNNLNKGDVVVFICWCRHCNNNYLSAIATVDKSIKHTDIWDDSQYSLLRSYFNLLLSKENGVWKNKEPLYKKLEHKDWFYRISNKSEVPLIKNFSGIEVTVSNRIGKNYIIFDSLESYILKNQIMIATGNIGFNGKNEQWIEKESINKIKDLVFDKSERRYLRSSYKGQNPHRQIRHEMDIDYLKHWKKTFISLLIDLDEKDQ